MNKETTVWAIKLNSFVIELRAAGGPVKVIRSTMKKVIKTKRPDHSVYPTEYRDVAKTIAFKQTTLIGGRFLANVTPYTLKNKIGEISFAKDDVVKLSETQARDVLSLRWRRANLR